MDIFSVLSMIGGLSLFLYGMHIMGEGLSKLSGGRLEKVLGRLTSKAYLAVALGAAVTAVIQSSSATTVMVVGFVNSGIMKLTQAVGIIMGANVGTTVTSWILSLTGIESDSFFIQLLKPTSFSPVLALIGVSFILFSKKEIRNNIGGILIGFAILMFGMDTMSSAVKPLANEPGFMNLLLMFSNPFLGVLAGAVLTAVIQSSSASVGILQALCITGAVNFSTAVPIIMGQNIGTCVTAMISCVGANKNAKRAALVHLYFNIIGSIVFLVLFYGLNAVFHFPFMNMAANAWGIAVVHSVFNLFAVLLLLPFRKQLVNLAYVTIPESEEEQAETPSEFSLLDERFLDTPALAVAQCRNVAVNMAYLAKESLFDAIKLIGQYDKAGAERVVQLEKTVDRYEDELGTYLVKVGSRDLSEKDSRTISILLHSIGDFERLSDHAVNIVEVVRQMNKKDMKFSSKARKELNVFMDAIKEIVDKSVVMFENEDTDLAKTIEPLEEVIDDLNDELKKRHVKRLRKGKCTIELGIALTDLTTNFERVADHCSNLAVCLLQINEDSFETHEYLDMVKRNENTGFKQMYRNYRIRYELPE